MSGGAVEQAAAILRRGGLVAFPTETVYGLGANALDPEAVARIYRAKNRPRTSPLIVHAHSLEMARRLVAAWPDSAARLARSFWPGPLTLVLPKSAVIPDIVSAGLSTVGVRVPDHPVALALIRAAGVPVAAPSANRFSRLSATSAEHVRRSLGDAVDMILEGDPPRVGIESTVLSLVGETPVVLRPGMITPETLETLIGPVRAARDTPDEGVAAPSPGMTRRHYSPVTPLHVVTAAPLPPGRGAYLWWRTRQPAARCVAMPGEAAAYAALLYDMLHRLDAEAWDWIAVEEPPHDPEWTAIHDRLQRARQR